MPTYPSTTAKKFLDYNGLAYFAQKLNDYPDNTVLAAVIDGIQDALDEKVDSSSVGASSGVAELDSSGCVPVEQLPDAVYDILEYNAYSDFPLSGVSEKLYIDKSTNGVYRWNGTDYTRLNPVSATITDAEIDALFT